MDRLTRQRRSRRLNLAAALVFAVQIPLVLALVAWDRKLWNVVALPYLVFLSLWALVASHLAGASAEIPTVEDPDE